MLVRIGIPDSFRRFSTVAREIGAPVMVSAGGFWRNGRFRLPRDPIFSDLDVALDSAGFVAMTRYWGYRWKLDDYVDFAKRMKPTWWAAPDYCCEWEVARDRAEVLERVKRTAFKLDWARQVAADRGVPPPMPVLQGWYPDDYLRCADMIPDLPQLVGVGSVCRRSLGGPAGIMRLMEAFHRRLPKHILLHLFGAKGQAVRALAGHPRVHSIDSCAWDYAARREKERDGETSRHAEYRTVHMQRWYKKQHSALGLWGYAPMAAKSA